jgi:hypothetical protein
MGRHSQPDAALSSHGRPLFGVIRKRGFVILRGDIEE